MATAGGRRTALPRAPSQRSTSRCDTGRSRRLLPGCVFIVATDGPLCTQLAAARQIWLGDLQTFLDSGVVDGLFADKGNAWPGHGHCNGPKSGSCWKLIGRNDTLCQNSCVIIGEAEAAAYTSGKRSMLAAAEAKLRSRGGLLALKNDTDPLYASHAVYKRLVDPSRSTIEEFIALQSRLDTLIAWALPGNSPRARNQTRWHNTLSAFLIAAWDGMFLMASPCCGTSATDAWTDVYGYPLGSPLGKAKLGDDGVFRREFASGTRVVFDTNSDTGSVEWASEQSVYDPAE